MYCGQSLVLIYSRFPVLSIFLYRVHYPMVCEENDIITDNVRNLRPTNDPNCWYSRCHSCCL